jgi:hypothetical protein
VIIEQAQRRLDDGVLETRLVRSPQGVSVPERDDECPRRPHPSRNLAQELNHHRRNSLTLHLGSDQAHGLVAERSDRHQQCDLDVVGAQPACHLGRRIAH